MNILTIIVELQDIFAVLIFFFLIGAILNSLRCVSFMILDITDREVTAKITKIIE